MRVRGLVSIAAAFVGALLLSATAADAAGWSVTSVPAPVGGESSLNTVSCPSAKACTAVGYSAAEGAPTLPLAERWNGSTWSLEANPATGATGALLYGVSCPVKNDCIAVGAAGPSHADAFAETWNSLSWAVLQIPSQHRGSLVQDSLATISCRSSTACLAVGGVTNSLGTVGSLLAERWNGHNWTLLHPPASLHGIFTADTCTSANSCVVVGDLGNPAAPGGKPLIERWTGRAWKREPTPTSVKGGSLSSISCTSAGACTAVGGTTNAGPLILRWNGKHWTRQPAPGGVTAGLTAVSCTSAKRCAAVGNRIAARFTTKTLAEVWTTGSWKLQATPNLGSDSSALNGLACHGKETCVAVGYRDGPGASQFPLAERHS